MKNCKSRRSDFDNAINTKKLAATDPVGARRD